MTDLQIYLTLGIFGAVILSIAFDVIDMAVAALLGVSLLFLFNILDEDDVIAAIKIAGGPLALLFGGMVVARTLSITGIFDRIGSVYLRATKGSGKRFLLLLIMIVAPLCAFLPNATTVILLAPIIVRVAVALKVDFVGPMVLTAIVSNSAGLLTLVGDPATFLVGSSIGMTFGGYLRNVSLAGLLSLLVLIPLLPALMKDTWRLQVALPPPEAQKPLQRPWFVLLALTVLGIKIALFLFGENLPLHVGPPAVAIIAASLALLVIYGLRVEPVDKALHDIDWKTLVFLGSIFLLMQSVTKTGLLQSASLKLYDWFGPDFVLAALSLIAGIGLLSSLLANIPVVAASIVMVKGYLVAVEAVPDAALGAHFTDWPAAVIPVFIAMMFGATLGGNATLIGASANIVTVGVCAQHGKPVTFVTWLRYGLPITACQLAAAALYTLGLFYLTR